ncbi:hypothetical protein J7T55_010842 [Diaporthe amygdali]|uniref:uncharacterized protein n=1 Tax=Phomopsis amygdali TaxID=1214568 RepID=UPI0022FEF8B4|nr:uncharacterized protein J7T55_010842 [Diaporthe amygdali]KAJ0114452.1 hypothetical protein J7T55_010842 [Diaporthe amygdali]
MEQLRSAIRYLTFELLEIRHTCSHDEQLQEFQRDDNEIHELMSEDNSLLQLLEELVEEFESKFQSLRTEDDPYGISFWETYWPQRMREVITELNDFRLSEDEYLSAQSLGVKWHQTEDGPEWHSVDPANLRSDWSVEVDDEWMWRRFKSVEDWRSRLELIMSRAYSK